MTTMECIHGLDPALCDICRPRPAVPTVARAGTDRPRAPRTAAVRTASGRSTAPRGTTRSAGVRAPAAPPAPRVDLAAQRLLHVTPIATLEAIVADGALRGGAHPDPDLSSSDTRELRASTPLPDGSTAADRVAFYLTPDATRWTELRDGAVGPAWSDAARTLRSVDTVALVTTVGALDGDAVLADGDAAATVTRFTPVAPDPAVATVALRRIHSDPDRLAGAEALGPAEVPLSSITLIVVANEPARERVRALLAGAGLRTKVSVNPPWFQGERS